MSSTFKKALPFLFIYAFVLILYYPVISTYFSHDDFFHFKVSLTDGSFKEFINFFGFHSFEERNIAFYRPIFREVLYNSFHRIFGLNSLPFRILSFTIHFINIFLIFKFMKMLFKNNYISYISTFFFGVTAANVAPFYYLAGGIQTQGATMFILTTLILFTRYLESKKSVFMKLSFMTFLLALASHEQSAILPILLAGLILVNNKPKQLFKDILKLWPFFFTVLVYIFLNIKLIGYSSGEAQYRMVFNIKTTLQTLSWYIVWALGLPETFIDFLLPGFKLNPNLMKYWGNYYRIIFPSFAVATIGIGLVFFYLVIKKGKMLIDKKLWFLIIWFPLGILPVIFLPSHKSTHYLYPSLPAFWGTAAFLIYNSYLQIRKFSVNFSKTLFALILISLITLSSVSATLGRTTYWAAARGKVAEKLIKDVKTQYPVLPKGAAVYFKNDPSYPYLHEDWGGTSKQASFALNGEDGLQLLYNDPTLRVFYEDLGGLPQNFINEKTYTLTAHIR
ncbi:hypothetical protein A3D01_04835 [Candidatus Woesebacteria bacterium RIFCSPHIGHO2_02_FULL_39_13]|uniref:Glycosyltransferase RgtA/B/C/D-like domain-containing protein n=1 Tax=Candidatus Woesebacteria bacterium RIFCSPHIGHO2_02_FULL_39_13 TaxID=1802505 RepID=A0A1F7YZV9_9BACT|nr:MAG: hypothetical protein A2692_00155 [Candidatus Woesebacteria bacterium RIFCSPHIGHO2_01_FULL_39_95]OGM32872.1 MAG: hypothetical protein A3D01_04835 [Candidatus Woesebacteria bacterium RIFCSPHIGHO2_02_FULL_39_13]OGM74385.1 MAG: hypothetical protein A3H19_05145 [Candidatus Woesebacteria bacterium RIFCSPLOWO2_12_FULL_39_9]